MKKKKHSQTFLIPP